MWTKCGNHQFPTNVKAHTHTQTAEVIVDLDSVTSFGLNAASLTCIGFRTLNMPEGLLASRPLAACMHSVV